MIVLDASAWVEALLGSDTGQRVRERLRADRWVAGPQLVKYEVMAAIRGLAHAGALDDVAAAAALARVTRLEIVRVPVEVLMPRMWELRHNLTSYDASYVAAAEVAGAPLVTCDAAMASVPAPRCAVELVLA